jgi:hypothetical protein
MYREGKQNNEILTCMDENENYELLTCMTGNENGEILTCMTGNEYDDWGHSKAAGEVGHSVDHEKMTKF